MPNMSSNGPRNTSQRSCWFRATAGSLIRELKEVLAWGDSLSPLVFPNKAAGPHYTLMSLKTPRCTSIFSSDTIMRSHPLPSSSLHHPHPHPDWTWFIISLIRGETLITFLTQLWGHIPYPQPPANIIQISIVNIRCKTMRWACRALWALFLFNLEFASTEIPAITMNLPEGGSIISIRLPDLYADSQKRAL